MDLELSELFKPVPVRVKSDTPSSRALRGVQTTRAMFDFGDSRRGFFEVDRVRCAMKLPPYVDLDFPSGVKGEVLIEFPDCAGEGVSGIRPPAVRVENSALCDLIGVDTVAVAMMSKRYRASKRIGFCFSSFSERVSAED